MKILDYWLNSAIKLPSPNFDDRPDPDDISLLVIHSISLPPEQFGGGFVDQFFCNQLNPDDHAYFKEIIHLKVSAHLLIKRCGEIVQFVAFDKRAWHAGESTYNGREKCNDFSIGIELEGSDNQNYTDPQYSQLISVTKALMHSYPAISMQKIVGHCDIAPGRKTDPGRFFNWGYFKQMQAKK